MVREEITPPELDISPEKVAWIIERAREFEAKVAPFDDGDPEAIEDQYGSVLENQKDDPILQELAGFFAALNEDEEANLVAIAWIGRGTYGAEEWGRALATARAEKTTGTGRYLLGMPLLADHLADGMAALGLEVEGE
jgi:hypothetical protein